MPKILVFGDSIAWGAFDSEKGGWVERLKTHFLQSYKEKGVGVYNLSVSSNDTRGVLNFLEADIEKINTIEKDELIFLFSIGSNDPRGVGDPENTHIPEEEFTENVQKIIAIARKHSKKVFFTGLMKVDDTLTQPWNEHEYWKTSDIERYDKIISEMCVAEKVDFLPLFDLISDADLSDGLHPNEAGHEKIYQQIKSELEHLI